MPVLHAHELNSKGVLMIKLFNVALLPYDAARLPDDSWLEIMLTCTPRELLAMQLVSHRFYRILASNPHSWPQARNNLDPPVPPPPKDIEAAGVWTEAAYAQFIFGGRDCVVKSCKRWTTNFPLSFGLRIRVCSDHCKNAVARNYDKVARKIKNGYITSVGIPGRRGLRKIGQTQRLHFRDWLVYDERDLTQHRTYRVATLAEADQEWWAARAVTEKRSVKPQVKVSRSVKQLQEQFKLRAKALPAIMENAEALQKWAEEFEAARKAVELANVLFVKTVISPREQLHYRKLLSTPTVRMMLKLYGDSLGKIDIRAWCSVRPEVIKEYKIALVQSRKELEDARKKAAANPAKGNSGSAKGKGKRKRKEKEKCSLPSNEDGFAPLPEMSVDAAQDLQSEVSLFGAEVRAQDTIIGPQEARQVLAKRLDTLKEILQRRKRAQGSAQESTSWEEKENYRPPDAQPPLSSCFPMDERGSNLVEVHIPQFAPELAPEISFEDLESRAEESVVDEAECWAEFDAALAAYWPGSGSASDGESLAFEGLGEEFRVAAEENIELAIALEKPQRYQLEFAKPDREHYVDVSGPPNTSMATTSSGGSFDSTVFDGWMEESSAGELRMAFLNGAEYPSRSSSEDYSSSSETESDSE